MEDPRVFKYGFNISDEVVLEMPQGAILLTVAQQGMQRHALQLWAQVTPDNPLVKRKLRVYGTGHPMVHMPGAYITSVQMNGGMLVWHIFDAGEVR
jgi:hypothetical protein